MKITIFHWENGYEWVQNEGKSVLMFLLSIKNLYEEDLEKQLGRVKCKINKRYTFDFIVNKENSDDTIDKIME